MKLVLGDISSGVKLPTYGHVY